MKHINLTVIADKHCQTTHAYLEYMRAHDYLPDKVILVEFLSNNRKVKLVQKFLGKKITAKLVAIYRKNRPRDFQKICENLQINQPVEVNYFARKNFANYAKNFEKLIVNDYSDLKVHLIKERHNAILYAGGGIVPEGILNIDGLKIIHIHPGVVPEVKGSDGFFWSMLVNGKIGMSCFYMNKGIDTGEIIKTKEYDIPKISTHKSDSLYKAILYSLDPHFRADVLIDVLNENYSKDLKFIAATKQDPEDGRTFFAMHTKLRDKLLEKL
jgi:methionyl-tRNA formyltransferase